MKILITGATGSLGAFLTRHFSEKGHEIIASGKQKHPPQKLKEFATYYCADITEKITFPDVDAVIHTAAISDDKAAEKDLFNANVTGTKNVINATKSAQKFIHISSSSVYVPSESIITEDFEGEKGKLELAPYGKSKLLSEKVVKENSEYQSCFILRPRALYGSGDKVILPRLLKLVKNEKLKYPGNLQVKISMTHYNNIAHAVELCLNSDKKGIHTYNVSDDETYILLDVMRIFTKNIYGKTLQEKQIPLWIPKLMSIFKIGGITPLLIRSLTKNMVLDISRIKKELGYKPKATVNSTINETAEWVQHIGGVSVIKTGKKELAWNI